MEVTKTIFLVKTDISDSQEHVDSLSFLLCKLLCSVAYTTVDINAKDVPCRLSLSMIEGFLKL